jgi:hypothetical protein
MAFHTAIDFNFVFVAGDTKNRVQNAIVGCGCHSSVLPNKQARRSKMT